MKTYAELKLNPTGAHTPMQHGMCRQLAQQRCHIQPQGAQHCPRLAPACLGLQELQPTALLGAGVSMHSCTLRLQPTDSSVPGCVKCGWYPVTPGSLTA